MPSWIKRASVCRRCTLEAMVLRWVVSPGATPPGRRAARGPRGPLGPTGIALLLSLCLVTWSAAPAGARQLPLR